jgi:TonB family protein
MTVLIGLLLTGVVFCLASAITDMKRSMFYRMSRVLVAASLLSVAVTGNSQTPNAAKAKHYAIYAPRPNYPLHARQYHWTGEGLFWCNIRSDGTVASVDVLQSTGHEMLDRAAIKALRQWRFHPGDMNAIKIPINFSMSGTGSPVRHRMSGAVIPD